MKIWTTCDTCGTGLVGRKLNRIGDKYYCHSDYSKQLEKERNKEIERKSDENRFDDIQDLVGDLEDWNQIECTVSNNTITSLE